MMESFFSAFFSARFSSIQVCYVELVSLAGVYIDKPVARMIHHTT